MKYQDIYQKSINEKESFWEEQAKQIPWFEFPKTILSQDENGFYRWYEGGKMNTCYVAVDQHVLDGKGDQVALIYDSPVTGQLKKFTFNDLQKEVIKVAAGLQQLGVEKGDRVIIYMPMIPEVVFAMLACARIGAIHSVVFGGFAAHELAIRIDDAKPKVLLTASCGIEINRIIPYKPIIDAAIQESKFGVEKVVVFQRPLQVAALNDGQDMDWSDFINDSKSVDCVPLDATDPLYILYTSGTTGTPKGIVRDNGGHAVALKFSMKNVYAINPGEVYWAASDVGWVVGHSYIVYAPLIHGCTTVLYEGKPVKTPDPGAFFRVIDNHKVNVFFTAPTAFRAIKKEDSEGHFKSKYDISSLKYLFLAGERCDVATLNWCKNLLKVPVIDHWWQTESGWPMIANPAGIELQEVIPGSATLPVCGYDVYILNNNSEMLPAQTEGAVVVKLPMPPGTLPTLWGDDTRFINSYLKPFPGYYFSGDGGYKNDKGYVFITGRMDDIINVAGHRLSTAEMEEVVASHAAVAECAVVGVYDELKGQIPVGFFVLKSDQNVKEYEIQAELIKMVRDKIGPVASFKRAIEVKRLPKTRSGKILRKIMRAIADGNEFSTPSTIEDITVLEELSTLMKESKIGNFS